MIFISLFLVFHHFLVSILLSIPLIFFSHLLSIFGSLTFNFKALSFFRTLSSKPLFLIFLINFAHSLSFYLIPLLLIEIAATILSWPLSLQIWLQPLPISFLYISSLFHRYWFELSHCFLAQLFVFQGTIYLHSVSIRLKLNHFVSFPFIFGL